MQVYMMLEIEPRNFYVLNKYSAYQALSLVSMARVFAFVCYSSLLRFFKLFKTFLKGISVF